MEERVGSRQDNDQRFQRERNAFFDWIEEAASRNADYNRGLSEEEVLELIEKARDEIA